MNNLSSLIIAHRGESFDAPENTLASICLAWERGVKSVEIDIRLTKDNEVVVIHDRTTKRVSGRRKIVRKTALEELKKLNAGKHKGLHWNNETIPTLKEVLNSVPSHCRLIIEIKSDSKILGRLKHELDNSDLECSQIELIGFNAKTLARAKQLMPGYKMLLLLNLDYCWPRWIFKTDKNRIIEQLRRYNLDGIDVWSGKALTSSFIEKFKQNGLEVYAWTVDSYEEARCLVDNGIDGLTSNRAAWLIKELNSNYHG